MASMIFPRIALRTALARSVVADPRKCRCIASLTTPLMEKHTIKVPTMGDSITEGTIVEWTAQVGQMVKDGDVVALVETDKVTVDIKADMDGVVTQQFGEIDDTVEVGADLYEIDTEAEATVAAAESATPAEAPPAPTIKEQSTPPVTTSVEPVVEPEQHRSPSIKFLGKEGWMRRRSGQEAVSPVVYGVPTGYGRPKFTEDEIEALIMGGANLVPDVKQHSSGAVFSS